MDRVQSKVRRFARRLDLKDGVVEMKHGGGGLAMAQLIEELFVAAFDNPALQQQGDAALLPNPSGRLVMATDSHVVSPLVFPGGDIGSLSVHGTINDVAMAGARPLHMAASFILEEGCGMATLARVVDSMAAAAREVGVPIVTGDTKVVQRGHGDEIYITTTGVGVVDEGIDVAPECAKPGDAIVVSGPIGEHGIAVFAAREDLKLHSPIRSDTAPLHTLVQAMLEAVPQVRCLRDPTRGGLGAALNELAFASGVGMRLREADIPVREEVRAACEILGFDPIFIANEGKLVAICPAAGVDALLAAMRAHPCGVQASLVGEVCAEHPGTVEMETVVGGRRVVDWLTAEQLPRIC